MKVQGTAADGKTIEVEVTGVVAEADIAAKYIPKESVTQIVQDRLTQFARGHVKIEGLDEAGKRKLAIETLGLKLAGDGEATSDIGKQITQAKSQWAKEELEPVLARETAAKGEVETLRRSQLKAAIRAAGARFFKDVLLTPPVAGASSPLETMLEPAHGFNESTRSWHVKGADGFAISSDPQKYGVYKTPEEAVAELAKNPAYKDFLRVETQDGPGLQGGGTGGEGRIVLTREQAGNAVVYADALKKVGGDHARLVVNEAA